METEELLDHQRELVGGAVRVGRDAPVVREVGAVEETDHRLGVADVDREKHRPRSLRVSEIEADVERDRGVRERADRDEVGSGPAERRKGIEGDTARDLDRARTRDRLDGLEHLRRLHVVEQHDVGTGIARFLHLLERVALDLDHPTGPTRRGPARSRVGSPARRDGCP